MRRRVTFEDHLVAVLKHRMGLGVEFAMLIGIDQLEDGRWRVWLSSAPWADPKEEELFTTPREAVRRFLKLRDERKLGFDYERSK